MIRSKVIVITPWLIHLHSFIITAHPEVTFTSTAVTAAVFFSFLKSRIRYKMFKFVLKN